MDIQQLSPQDMTLNSLRSLAIFKNLTAMSSKSKRRVDRYLMHSLLGTSLEQLKDPYLVTTDTIKLLQRDRDTARAIYLAREAGENGIVAMNAIMEWYCEQGDPKGALKLFHDRKKWRIAPNKHTYIILFSGISKASQWGKVSASICESCYQIFQSYREQSKDADKNARCDIDCFNALLSLLIKNYKNDQELSWTLFEELVPKKGIVTLIPDIRTFTIFLNGIRQFHKDNAQKIRDCTTLSNNEKAVKLLENQARLVQTAELIRGRVFAAAMPPKPPTREEANEDPEVLLEYRKKAHRILMDIDGAFVSIFLSCYINDWAGTGRNIGGGSHHKYAERGLEYMRAWMPEINGMVQFLEQTTGNTISSVDKSVAYLTQHRVARAEEWHGSTDKADSFSEFLPDALGVSMDTGSLNPTVIFPPPISSRNKTRAIFSDSKKPLIDLKRVTLAEQRLVAQDKAYRQSRGKYGKKMPGGNSVSSTTKDHSINSILLNVFLQSLVELGKKDEFCLATWYSLLQWGGLYVNKTQLAKHFAATKDLTHTLAESDYPVPLQVRSEENIKPVPRSLSPGVTKPTHATSVVDIKLFENFIYKISTFNDRSSIALIADLFAALASPSVNLDRSLIPRSRTIDLMFQSFRNEISRCFEVNHLNLKSKGARPDSRPKDHLEGTQLKAILESLNLFMDLMHVLAAQWSKLGKGRMPNEFISEYSDILHRLYSVEWKCATEEMLLEAHKQIIRSGILLYKPRELILKADPLRYSLKIATSLNHVYHALKETPDLSADDSKLRTRILALFRLEEGSSAKIDGLRKSIYTCIREASKN